MLQLRIIRPSSSAWSSPLHLVPNKTGHWHPCGNYHALNTITVPDHYPIPHLHDFSATLHGTTVFSKLDLTSIDFKAIATAQTSDPELKRIRATSTSLKLALEGAKTALVCDTSTGKKRTYVPPTFRRQVFDALHSLAHPGICATLMFANGLVSVYSVKGIKYIVIQSHHYPPSIHLMLDLTTSTLTLLDCCLPQTATPTCSDVLIGSPVR